MPPKNSDPIQNPNPPLHSSSSSSSEEEEVSEDQVESTQEEEDQDQDEDEGEGEASSEDADDVQGKTATYKKASPTKPETSAPPLAVHDSGSDSDSDAPAPFVKPFAAAKPVEETPNVRRTRSSSVKAPSTAKRPATDAEPELKEAKRPKPKKKAAGEWAAGAAVEGVNKSLEDGKKLFQRIFSEDDEIYVLQGMLDFSATKRGDPYREIESFYEFVKDGLPTKVTKDKLKDKIKRLRRKFNNIVGKGNNGEVRTFSKPHEQKIFDLSKMIWGKDGIYVVKSEGKAVVTVVGETDDKKVKVEWKKWRNLIDKNRWSRVEEFVLKDGLGMINGRDKKAALEEKWKNLKVAELELFLKKIELVKELGAGILQGIMKTK